MILPNDRKDKKVKEILTLLNGFTLSDIDEILDCVSDRANNYLTLNFKEEKETYR